MKAVVLKSFGGVDNFELCEVEMPIMKENDLLVKIRAAAFNPIDYQMRRGDSESKLLQSLILGREFAGTIVSVGNSEKDFVVGEEVVAYAGSLASNGTYAEYISVPRQLVARKPATLSFAEAAAVPLVGMTALQCVERLKLSSKDLALVCGGAGGVGTMVIQLLKSEGVDRIITTAGNIQSREHLLSLGLRDEQVVDYRQPNLVKQLQEAADHDEFDCCIDLVGGAMSEFGADLLKVQGTYVDVTNLSTLNARNRLFDKATMIMNVSNYAYALSGKASLISRYGKDLQTIFLKMESGIIYPPTVEVVGQLSVETVQKAHTILENNETRGRKLIMVIED